MLFYKFGMSYEFLNLFQSPDLNITERYRTTNTYGVTRYKSIDFSDQLWSILTKWCWLPPGFQTGTMEFIQSEFQQVFSLLFCAFSSLLSPHSIAKYNCCLPALCPTPLTPAKCVVQLQPDLLQGYKLRWLGSSYKFHESILSLMRKVWISTCLLREQQAQLLQMLLGSSHPSSRVPSSAGLYAQSSR